MIRSPDHPIASVFANVDFSPIGVEVNLRTALAYGSSRGNIPVVAVAADVEIEVALDVTVIAFCIQLEPRICRNVNNDLAALVVDINSS